MKPQQQFIPSFQALQLPQLSEVESSIRPFQITENTLKMQNIALATRIDYLKRVIVDQKRLLSEMVEREIRHQRFFRLLHQVWSGFLHRNLRMNATVKRRGDCKLEAKFQNAFQYLDEIFHSQDMFSNNVEEAFKKQISSKFEQFLRLIENIYMEISQEYREWNGRIVNAVSNLEGNDENLYVRNLLQSCQDLIQKHKDLELSFKQKLKVRERKMNDLEGQFAQQSVFSLQKLLSESRMENENLSRRVRLLSQYNMRAISQKIEEEVEDMKVESFECVCGGTQMQGYRPLIMKQDYSDLVRSSWEGTSRRTQGQHIDERTMSKQVNVALIQQLLQRAVKNRALKMQVQEDNTYTIQFNMNEAQELENLLASFYSIQSKCDSLIQVNKNLADQQVSSQMREKQMQLQLTSTQDRFFEQPIFKILQQHNNHLIEQNSQLALSLQQLQSQITDQMQSNIAELHSLKNAYEQEIYKLSIEIGSLRRDLIDKRTQEFQNIQATDIEPFLKGLRERNDSLQKVVDAQLKELISQKHQLTIHREKIEKSDKKRIESEVRVQELENVTKQQQLYILNQKIIALQSKLPQEYPVEQMQFRHSKHKEFITELNSHIQDHLPQFKEKFNELASYLKSRDQRVESLDKQLNQIQKTTIADLKRQQELLLEETDFNQKTYEEFHKKSQLVESQLSKSFLAYIYTQEIKEKQEAQLIQEKIAEKANFQNEKSQLMAKLKTAEDIIKKQTNQLYEMQNLLNQSQGEVSKNNESFHLIQISQLNVYSYQLSYIFQKRVEELQMQNSLQEIEYQQLKQSIDQSTLINQDYIKQTVELQSKLSELQAIVQQKEDILNDPGRLEQLKGYIILKNEKHNDEKFLISKIKQVACCSDCKTQLKEIVISKCMHMLCSDCAKSSLQKECCPVCKVKVEIFDFWKTKIFV